MIRLQPFLVGFTLSILSLGFSALTWANSHEFDARYKVKAMGISVGNLKQSMRCQQQTCTLTNKAQPPRWAYFFINESSVETIKLKYLPTELKWLQYHKDLERRYSDRTVHKKTDMHLNLESNEIVSVQKNLSWPSTPYAYDMISLVHALRFYAQKGGELPPFILQDEREQTQVTFDVENKSTTTHLNYKSNVAARFFDWNTDKHRVKVWLIEELDLFPGRIDFYDIENDRRLLLILSEPPKTR